MCMVPNLEGYETDTHGARHVVVGFVVPAFKPLEPAIASRNMRSRTLRLPPEAHGAKPWLPHGSSNSVATREWLCEPPPWQSRPTTMLHAVFSQCHTSMRSAPMM